MEDRHYFSDARPVYGSTLPTWEVDVFRTGVEEPVFTLTINNETLPPRMGKKKKIAWKLPTSQGVKPNFAAAEKARLYDLFKAQKKNRRKSKRNSQTTCQEQQQLITPAGGGNNILPTNNPNPAEDGDSDQTPPNSPTMNPTVTKGIPEKGKHTEAIALSSPLDDKSDLPIALVTSPPPSISLSAPPPPPPGISIDKPIHQPPPPSSPPTLPSTPPPGFSHLTIQEATTTIDNHADADADNLKYFCPTSIMDVPTELAQLFMDIYYSSLTHGEDAMLLDYYTENAQKSLSVGTAHAYCHSPLEIRVQLERLRESLWDIRGIVTQPSITDSVMILITGTALPKASPNTLPFCHAVTLTRVSEKGYQIHNDALSLLTDG